MKDSACPRKRGRNFKPLVLALEEENPSAIERSSSVAVARTAYRSHSGPLGPNDSQEFLKKVEKVRRK